MKKKIEEKIIEYLDGRMNSAEKLSFEKEIENSGDLKTQVQRYKKLFADFSTVNNQDINSNYFDSILPEFHKRNNKKFNQLPRLAAAFASFIIVALISWYAASSFLISPQNETANHMLSEEEMLQAGEFTIDEMGNFIQSDSIITNMLSSELRLNEDENIFKAADEYDITFIDESLSIEDADYIYAQLIEKNFFNGEEYD